MQPNFGTNVFGFPILSLITYLPLAGAIFLLFVNKEKVKFIKYFAFAVALVDFLISIPLWFAFDRTTWHFQFVERFSWIKALGVEYYFGVDGISLLLFLLTTFLTAISVLSSFNYIQERDKEYYIAMLVLETGMLGVFVALDLFLFYVFWEVMLVPMYFLIGIWGYERRLYAAIKFFLYTLFGSLFMLIAIISMYFLYHHTTGEWSFNYVKWVYNMHIPGGFQFWLFLAFFLGFAIKVPLFPFHTWLPDAHVEAPTAGSVILAGILLKMGTYGFVRFSLPLFPEASRYFIPFIALLSIIAIIYGALCALAQEDMKKLVAYSSVSHMGLVMLAMFALNPIGIQGSVLQMLNHGVSTGALFLIVGIIYERRHTRLIREFGGLSKVVPAFATFFMITMLSSIGLPGLNGFIGEFTCLAGVFKYNWRYAAFAVTGVILGAGYMLWLYQRTMFGRITNPKNIGIADMNLREWIYMTPLVITFIWIGIYPKPVFNIMKVTVDHLVEQVNPDYFKQKAQHEAKLKKALFYPTKSGDFAGAPSSLKVSEREKSHRLD
ncbi:MAG: NADH-quinone oxidoreductase subunit M [Aquificota bacterium]|nr:MAG: NADH-quinone oxidoreductase subunit M [Aquificota bacterium]